MWPDTYRERHAALQRGLRIFADMRLDAHGIAEAGRRLAEDPEAMLELGDALPDIFKTALAEVLAP